MSQVAQDVNLLSVCHKLCHLYNFEPLRGVQSVSLKSPEPLKGFLNNSTNVLTILRHIVRLSVTNRVFNRLKDFEIAYHKR